MITVIEAADINKIYLKWVVIELNWAELNRIRDYNGQNISNKISQKW